MMFFYEGVPFYLAFSFNHSHQVFILYILLGDTVTEAQKYRVRIWVEEIKKQAPRKVVFHKRIVSIEAALDIGILMNIAFQIFMRLRTACQPMLGLPV